MNNGLIVLLDGDTEYISCLSDYLDIHTSLGYQTVTFSDMKEFLQFATPTHIDILLVEDCFFESIPIYKLSFDNLFILNNQRIEDAVKRDSFTFNVFFKYQSAELLIHKIMSNLNTIGIKNTLPKTAPTILGVYSPVKRCGRTSFSAALAMTYSANVPTLFLSFDENASEYLDVHNANKTLSELIFYLLEDSSAFYKHIASVVCSVNGLDIIPPVSYSKDLRFLEADTLISFMSALRSTDYHYIVIDFSDTLSDITCLLKLCDKIYMPVIEDDFSRKKLSAFIHSAKAMDSGFSEDIFTLVTPPYFEYKSDDTSFYNQLMISPIPQYIASSVIGKENA